MLHIGGAVTEDAKPRAAVAGQSAHPEMGAHPAGVLERDEVVVVHLCSSAADLELGVDGLHWPEELNRLIGEMAAEIEEQPACLVGVCSLPPAGTDLGAPALEPGLEAKNTP